MRSLSTVIFLNKEILYKKKVKTKIYNFFCLCCDKQVKRLCSHYPMQGPYLKAVF
jgi:hypothetical protein